MSNDDFNQQIIDEFRANDGTVQTMGFGDNLILVHHVGAKSGTERVTPLFTIEPADDVWLIAASKAGAPDNPAWYYNLIANPQARIEVPRRGEVAVEAHELKGPERDQAWGRFTSASPGFAEYEQKTERTIPVLELRAR